MGRKFVSAEGKDERKNMGKQERKKDVRLNIWQQEEKTDRNRKQERKQRRRNVWKQGGK